MMRCNRCGGIMRHIITATNGEQYYQCFNGLTQRNLHGEAHHITLCNHIQNSKSRDYSGSVVFRTGEHMKLAGLRLA